MKNKFTFLALLIFVLTSISFAQTPVYVDAARPDNTGDGLSWGTAKKTIQAGVNLVATSGIVNVAAGTYAETVVITKALTMRGTQYGVDARTRSGSESIISSNNANGSVQIGPVAGAVNIDGFTVSGSPVKALQVTNVTTNVIVRNNIFNSATNDGINLFQAQNATVEYNWVKGASTSGIVAGNDNGTPSELDGVITTALIRYNKVENSTYGITGYQTGSTISYNEVIGNTSVGAGIGGQFYSTLISYNTVHGYTNGAGIAFNPYVNRANSSNVTAIFNNVYGNSAGVYINQTLAGSNIHVNRNQITGNTSYGAVFDVGGSGTLDAVYNWWGDLTGPYHSSNPSGSGNAVSNGVSFIPWLGSVTPQFTTYLLNPYDYAGLYGTTTTFSWYSGVPNIKYRLQVTLATDTYFYSPIINTVTTNTSYDANNSLFTPGTSYIWRVVSVNTGETVVWNFSDTRHFNMPALPTPYLSYPTGGVTIYTNPPTFYWYLGTYYPGLTFVVKYWKDGQPDPGYPPAVAQTANGGSFHTASTNFFVTLSATLTAGATYHWRVASTNDGGTTLSSWSTQGDFVVYSSTPATPPVPYPSWPVGGATSYINPPTFYWYLGTYATGLQFYFEYDNDSGMGSPTGNSGWITNMYYTLPSSLTLGTWYWHVKSRLTSTLVESSYSTIESFVIPASSSGSATVPTPTYPIGGVTVYTLSPTLSWYAYSTSSLEYQIKYARYSNVDGSGVLNHSTVVTLPSTTTWQSASTSSLSGLLAGATYYWQVRSRIAGTPGTESSWSYIVSFTTSPGASSVVPLIGSPSFGQPINSSSAVLSWILPTQSQSHLKYDLQYSTRADFSNVTTINDLDENQYQIKNLLPGEYFWKVLSKTSKGEKSSYSAVGNFRTGNVTDVPPAEQAIPTQFELSQNYPNPFNPTTIITYALPQNSFVSIKIYDMLGREVKTLVNGDAVAGKHSMEWNGEDNFGNKVASGIYLYRISATAQAGQATGQSGNFVSTRKMMLIK